jgi:hypothetical protein
MKLFWNLTTAVAVVALAMVIGCNKPAEEPTAPAAPTTTTTKQAAPPPRVVVPTTPTTPAQPQAQQTEPTVPSPQPVAPVSTAEIAKKVAVYETAYNASTDSTAKVGIIYNISDAGGAPAVESLGRLFQNEKNAELKVEIVDSLFDIDGQDQSKIAILTAAAGQDQNQDVRESAIDALTDIDAKLALPILQALTSDSNEDIRDAAKDAIDILKATGDIN